MGVLWDFGPPECDYSSSRPPKGTSSRKSTSFKLSTVKIRWPVGKLTESVRDTQTHTGKFIFCSCIALDRQKTMTICQAVLSNTGTLRTDRQTDGLTVIIPVSISRVSMLTRDKVGQYLQKLCSNEKGFSFFTYSAFVCICIRDYVAVVRYWWLRSRLQYWVFECAV